MDTPLHDHYVRSSNRLLFFDYDGTLVGFKPLPEQALPSKLVYRVLESLLADPRNTVVIVSGRDRQFLDQVFGHLALGMAAEHGFFIKPAGGSWRNNSDAPTSWKNTVRPILRAAAEAHPGSIIEEKTSALVWHYRRSSRIAETAARRLRLQLEPELAHLGLTAMPGHKVLEVRVAGVDKGQAAAQWLGSAPDFVLAAGDDTTDEGLFAAMPPDAHTIKVGRSRTAAAYRLPGPGALLALLKSLT